MYKQARISQRCASVRLTVPLLDRFVSCGTVPFLKFHEEEPSSVRVMDTVSGVAQYLRLYQEDCARGLRWSILELLTVISIIFRRYVAVYNSNMFWLLLDGDGHMVARNTYRIEINIHEKILRRVGLFTKVRNYVYDECFWILYF